MPKSHYLKKNIPTMGGIIIVLFFLFFYIIFFNIFNKSILFIFLYFMLNSIIGFLDDYIKCFVSNSNGLSIFKKYLLQSFITIIYIYILYNINIFNFKKYKFYFFLINIKYIYFFIWYILLMGCINSVNITDGLDGLVVFPLILNFLFLLIISIYKYKFYLFDSFNFFYLNYYKDFILINSIFIGCLLSFLFFNFYPAKIFLGDIGSLSIGSLIGSIYIFLNKEFYLILVGFVFLFEIISVIIQILWFNFFKKRFFKIAPIHHHYEICGYSELNIVLFFWSVSLFFFFLSLLIFIILNNV